VVVHRASWGDLNSGEMPALSRLLRMGAVGLMNAPQGARSGPDPAGPFLTIGAGRPVAEPAAPLGLRPDARYGKVYEVQGLGAVRKANGLTTAVPGLLGEELRQAGFAVAMSELGPEGYTGSPPPAPDEKSPRAKRGVSVSGIPRLRLGMTSRAATLRLRSGQAPGRPSGQITRSKVRLRLRVRRCSGCATI